MSLPPGYYVVLIHFLKVKELLYNSSSRSISPSNCNSLGTSILNESIRNKEIIKVHMVARTTRRLRQSFDQVQDYCLCLISTISSLNCSPKLLGVHTPIGPFLIPGICQFQTSKKPLQAAPQTLYHIGIGLFGTVVVSFDRPLNHTIISSTAKSCPGFQTLKLTS